MVTRAVEQVPALGGVQVEEDARHDDGFLLEQGVEEGEAVADVELRVGRQRGLERAQVEPDVEGAVGDVLVALVEADVAQAAEDVVALGFEVRLERGHFVAHFGRVEHRDRGFLEGHVGAAVQVGAAGAQGGDEGFGTDYPGHTPGDFVSIGVVCFVGRARRTHQPGSLKRLVRPSIRRTSSSSTSTTFEAAERVEPLQLSSYR